MQCSTGALEIFEFRAGHFKGARKGVSIRKVFGVLSGDWLVFVVAEISLVAPQGLRVTAGKPRLSHITRQLQRETLLLCK